MTTTKNARFWQFLNGDFVKMTLAPDRELTWTEAYATDEGFHRETITWTHEGDHVEIEVHTRSSDCDGPLTTHDEGFCTLDQLATWQTDDGMMLPTWQWGKSWQRDAFAEAMGY